MIRPRVTGLARFHRRRALPVLTVLDLAGHPGTGCHVGVLADDRARQHRGAGADGGIVADRDAPDVEEVAVDPVPAQIHLGLDRAAVPQRQETGDRWRRVQVDAPSDLGAQRTGVIHQPRRACEVFSPAGRGQPFGDPDPQMHGTATAVGARFHTGQQYPREQHRDTHPAQRRDEQHERRRDQPPVECLRPRHEVQSARRVVGQCQPCHPLQRRHRRERYRQHQLCGLGEQRRRAHHTLRDRRRRLEFVEETGHRPEPGMVVQVGDGHLRVALLPQRGDELRGRQRAAAEREEVGLGPVDDPSEHVAPQPGEPADRAAEVPGALVFGCTARRWPRQCVAVDLARRAGRQRLDAHQPRDQCRRQRSASRARAFARSNAVSVLAM